LLQSEWKGKLNCCKLCIWAWAQMLLLYLNMYNKKSLWEHYVTEDIKERERKEDVVHIHILLLYCTVHMIEIQIPGTSLRGAMYNAHGD
jgi:hypothetical protein